MVATRNLFLPLDETTPSGWALLPVCVGGHAGAVGYQIVGPQGSKLRKKYPNIYKKTPTTQRMSSDVGRWCVCVCVQRVQTGMARQ